MLSPKKTQIVTVLCLLQTVFKSCFFCLFVQAHLLYALTQKNNGTVDCQIGHGISKNPKIATVLYLLQTLFKTRFFVISAKRIYCPHLKKRGMEPSIVKIVHATCKNLQIAALLCLLQTVFKSFFRHFAQAHLLSALKKKSNGTVDCQNWS